jgi:hypothetical protein
MAENLGDVPSSSYETENDPSKFHVTVEKPDLIFKAITDTNSEENTEIGQCFLKGPIERIKVTFTTDMDTFMLNATINFANNPKFHPHSEEESEELIKERSDLTDSLRHLTLNNFNIVWEGHKDIISIITGKFHNKGTYAEIEPVPKPSRESFNGYMSSLSRTLERLVKKSYQKVGQESFGEELIIHPPELNKLFYLILSTKSP